MSDVWDEAEDFSVILIENFIRFETAAKNITYKESGGSEVLKVSFKIASQYYQQIQNTPYPAPLIGLQIDYDDKNEILTVVPSDAFLKQYENQIMKDVAFKQCENCKVRYSKFIQLCD